MVPHEMYDIHVSPNKAGHNSRLLSLHSMLSLQFFFNNLFSVSIKHNTILIFLHRDTKGTMISHFTLQPCKHPSWNRCGIYVSRSCWACWVRSCSLMICSRYLLNTILHSYMYSSICIPRSRMKCMISIFHLTRQVITVACWGCRPCWGCWACNCSLIICSLYLLDTIPHSYCSIGTPRSRMKCMMSSMLLLPGLRVTIILPCRRASIKTPGIL